MSSDLHVGVHATGNFCGLDEFVGFGEAEVSFNLVAGIKEGCFVFGFGEFDGTVEEGEDFWWKFVGQRIERTRHVVFVEVELCELFAGFEKSGADTAHGFHIDVNFDSHALTEDPDEFDGRSCGASAEPPDVGVEYVDSVDDGHER